MSRLRDPLWWKDFAVVAGGLTGLAAFVGGVAILATVWPMALLVIAAIVVVVGLGIASANAGLAQRRRESQGGDHGG